jgi:hypothetical protein
MKSTVVISRLVSVVALSSVAFADVVYDNSLNSIEAVRYGITEFGDEISLAAGERKVSNFSFQYYGDFAPATSPSASYQLQFYRNDGSDALPGSSTALRPSSLLWQSPVVPLINDYKIESISVPLIQVPDTFTWTVKFSGLSGSTGDRAGLILADPAVVGATLPNGAIGSYNDFWVKANANDSQSWALEIFGVGPGVAKGNFYVKVEAVPEPGTWVLLIAGTGLLLAAGRRVVR